MPPPVHFGRPVFFGLPPPKKSARSTVATWKKPPGVVGQPPLCTAWSVTDPVIACAVHTHTHTHMQTQTRTHALAHENYIASGEHAEANGKSKTNSGLISTRCSFADVSAFSPVCPIVPKQAQRTTPRSIEPMQKSSAAISRFVGTRSLYCALVLRNRVPMSCLSPCMSPKDAGNKNQTKHNKTKN